MSELEQRKIFSENLNRIINRRGLSQAEIADAIGVSPQTFNTWVMGKAIPRMNKLQALADYFSVPKSALIEEQPIEDKYALLQKVLDDKRILFDAAEDATPEEIQQAVDFLVYLKNKRG